MAKAKANVTEDEAVNETIVGRGVITNVGYNQAGNTSLVVRGTSLEVYGAKFVISITEGEYASYSSQYYTLFMGKEVIFEFETVDDMRAPKSPKFIRIE